VRPLRVIAGLVVLALFVGGLLLLEQTGNAAPLAMESSQSCRECHSQQFDEWESSIHAKSFTDPLVLATNQSNNFRKEECIPCHAPAPVFEHGIGKLERVVERVTAREEGVDCLSCHRMGDRVVGPAAAAAGSSRAACRPMARAELASPALCAPCHNQHNTVDEWEASSYPNAGVTCLDCHMQPVTRKTEDGTTRPGRSHKFPGGHDREMLAKAFTLRTEVVDAAEGGKKLVVHVSNSGAGHNFPADARHRALDLVVTLIQPDGVEVPPRESSRPYNRERGTARRRFRNPYREEPERITNREQFGRENTQILAGETVTLEVPYDPDAVNAARVELIYKLTPIESDDEGVRLHDARVPL
jgi:nitrate/TMAO reductase-like tetraheme cytochrome c subunit